MTSARTWCACASSSASVLSRSSRRGHQGHAVTTPGKGPGYPLPMPDEAPVTIAVVFSLGVGSAMARA